MPNLLIYATRQDVELIRTWINDDPDIAWLVKVNERDCCYEWKAVKTIDAVHQQTYALWHTDSGPLNVPSGRADVLDANVEDPFGGWNQTLSYSGATSPWFGSNLPGPYSFSFAEDGREAPGNLARSEFSWLGDRYKTIGKPANPAALKWWQRLDRFVKRATVRIPWVESLTKHKAVPSAHAFPDAALQLSSGRGRDINPWYPPKRDA